MPAALGRHLILKVQPGGPELDEGTHRAGNIEGPTPARIRIHQQRQIAGIGNAANVGQHVILGGNTEIGHAQRIGRHAAAGEINRLVPGILRQARGIGRDHAHHLQRTFGFKCSPKAGTGG